MEDKSVCCAGCGRAYDGSFNGLEAGGVKLHRGSRTLHMGDHIVRLTDWQFGLMLELMAKPGAFLRREHLASKLCGMETEDVDNVLSVQLSKLRRAIDNTVDVEGLGKRLVESGQYKQGVRVVVGVADELACSPA